MAPVEDRLDRRWVLLGLLLLVAQAEPEPVEALLAAVVRHVHHPRSLEIGDQRHVLVALGERGLVHPDVLDRCGLAARQPAPYRPLHDPRRLVPRDPQVLRHRRHTRLLQPVDRQHLEQRRELRARFRPRHLQLLDPVRRAVQSRHPRMHQGLELAGVEMSPRALLVVVDRGRRVALRAHPVLALGQRHPHVHLAVLQGGLDSLDVPRGPSTAVYRLRMSLTRVLSVKGPRGI